MKLVMMAAALMLSGAAVAQTTTEETPEDTTTTTSTTSTTSTPSTTMATGQAVAPGNASPETDARGIRVISAPAMAPSGYNQPAQQVPAGTPMPTMTRPTATAAGPLPPCTRTVTDRCTQTYERGRAR